MAPERDGVSPEDRRAAEAQTAARRLRALRAAMLGCVRCEALVKCRSRVVPGDGAAPAVVAFVGLAPGRLGGDRTGIPFSGDRSGDLLRRMIARAGLTRVFITNLVRCNPRDARGRNRDPAAREIANCRAHLAAELALVRPRVVACLGALAWREMAGREAPFNPRRPRARAGLTMLLYPMYHPGYVIRGAYAEQAYARDFARLARMLRRPVNGASAPRTLRRRGPRTIARRSKRNPTQE
ncbi:MAG TPA: uracil-DNA glycosylase [Candidatus Binataceae bacterium]|nr:uracil-DNA glycosylase [Candidatus Binataceae bacterium]